MNELKYESDQLDQLFTALAKAQGVMDSAKKESKNPFFKSNYADFSSVIEATREALTANGLAVIQRVLPNGDGNSYLTTRLGHSSGQWIESILPINPPKADIQSLGLYITYLKRYGYSAMVGVSTEDDDGERSMVVNEEQLANLNNLFVLLENNSKPSFLSYYKVNNLRDIARKDYERAIKDLNNSIKKEKNNGTSIEFGTRQPALAAV